MPSPSPPAAGYSGTPLARKLGIKGGYRIFVAGAPANYRKWLEPLPASVRFTSKVDAAVDMAHVFCARSADLSAILATLRKELAPDAVVWVSWPKKASKVATDVTEDTIRAVALPLGFVDVKVCAVDAIWSGLKLLVRRELR